MATSESTRARRFALPDLEDERTGESIEAFLEGPDVRRRRPAPRAAIQAAPPPRATDLRTLPGRLEFNAALERESLRAARYERPAAVAIVELKPDREGHLLDPWLKSLAGPISRTLRGDSRATDLVARVASMRFQMLLPETSEAGAERLAQRLAAGCRTLIESTGAPVSVRVSVAGTGADTSLHAALAEALRSIEAA
ncbi:MAG TPA: diguanylate cyclase [Candidatus Dormibacteraeota bacterium]|nr:diguanylate cyclase [Candidatus Dormibacteraeota bacterium]